MDTQDTHPCAHTLSPLQTQGVVAIRIQQPRAVGPKLRTAYECNIKFNSGGMLIVEQCENAGDILTIATPLPR